MNIYTRRGDRGETSTLAGERIAKDDLIIWVGGAIDELQTAIDRVVAQTRGKHRSRLERIQHLLWQLGGEISQHRVGGTVKDPIEARDTEELERWIDEAKLDLTRFVRFSSLVAIDVSEARVRARRLERIIATLAREQPVRTEVATYVNRLSDYLFALSVSLDKKPREQV